MNENEKKQIPLRISPKLFDEIAAWAEDDFRSVNGQIEYLLTECVRERERKAKNAAVCIEKTNKAAYENDKEKVAKVKETFDENKETNKKTKEPKKLERQLDRKTD